ncbi:hypothetical protein [Streptomyces sp. NPDC093089]|uniref:hypothetical protein n=1 Tax=Streptomyces sp. NPDC093089 TaxID=3366024 RepID=UPI00382DC2CF
MRLPKARAVAIAARLKAITGHEARLSEATGGIRVVASLPEELTTQSRGLILLVLADADRFGHEVTTDGSSVWVEIGTTSLDSAEVPPE